MFASRKRLCVEEFPMSLMVFPPLVNIPWLRHGFTLREPGVDVKLDRALALEALTEAHHAELHEEGIAMENLRLAEQVHGGMVAVVGDAADTGAPGKPVPQADGLVTVRAGIPLGIHVADCCAVFLVNRHRRAIGLLHSGRKGTEANIVAEGMRQLCAISGGDPAEVFAILSPCIQACCYEVDFSSEIERQLENAGVGGIWKQHECTGCDLQRYYSYHKEMGKTGRMLAFLMVTS